MGRWACGSYPVRASHVGRAHLWGGLNSYQLIRVTRLSGGNLLQICKSFQAHQGRWAGWRCLSWRAPCGAWADSHVGIVQSPPLAYPGRQPGPPPISPLPATLRAAVGPLGAPWCSSWAQSLGTETAQQGARRRKVRGGNPVRQNQRQNCQGSPHASPCPCPTGPLGLSGWVQDVVDGRVERSQISRFFRI